MSSDSVDLTHTVVLKAGNAFLVSQPDGEMPLGGDHALGVYRDDGRFLLGHELRVGGVRPRLLVVSAPTGRAFGSRADEPRPGTSGRPPARAADPADPARSPFARRHDACRSESTSTSTAASPSSSTSSWPSPPTSGRCWPCAESHRYRRRRSASRRPTRGMRFSARGARRRAPRDDRHRRSAARRRRPPAACGSTWRLEPGRGARRDRDLPAATKAARRPPRGRARVRPTAARRAGAGRRRAVQPRAGALAAGPADAALLARRPRLLRRRHPVVRHAVRARQPDHRHRRWLAWLPEMAEQTLRVLADRLGRRVDPVHEEEPGKVIHELRPGELAALGRPPLPATTARSTPRRCFSACSPNTRSGAAASRCFTSCARRSSARSAGSTTSATTTATACSTTTPAAPTGFATRAGATPTTACSTSTARRWSHRSR